MNEQRDPAAPESSAGRPWWRYATIMGVETEREITDYEYGVGDGKKKCRARDGENATFREAGIGVEVADRQHGLAASIDAIDAARQAVLLPEVPA